MTSRHTPRSAGVPSRSTVCQNTRNDCSAPREDQHVERRQLTFETIPIPPQWMRPPVWYLGHFLSIALIALRTSSSDLTSHF